MRKRWLSASLTQASVLVVAANGSSVSEGVVDSTTWCPNFDVVHLQDASDSFRKQGYSGVRTLMVDVLDSMKERLEQPISFRVGLASFVDKPYALVGSQRGVLGNIHDDWEYKPIEALKSGVDTDSFGQDFKYGGGADAKEGQLQAILSALADPKMRWRTKADTTRVVTLVTNSDYHVDGDLFKSAQLYERAWVTGDLCSLLARKDPACDDPASMTDLHKYTIFGPSEQRDTTTFRNTRDLIRDYPTVQEVINALEHYEAHLMVILVDADEDVKSSWTKLVSKSNSRLTLIELPSFADATADLASTILSFKDCTKPTIPPLPPVVIPTTKKTTTTTTTTTTTDTTKSIVDITDSTDKPTTTTTTSTDKVDDESTEKHFDPTHKIIDDDGDHTLADETTSKSSTSTTSKKSSREDVTDNTPADETSKPTSTLVVKTVTNHKSADESTDSIDELSDSTEPSHTSERTLPPFDKYYSPTESSTTTDKGAGPLPAHSKGVKKGVVAGAAAAASVGAVAVGAAIMKSMGIGLFGNSSVPNVMQANEASGQNPQMERETLEAIDADMFA